MFYNEPTFNYKTTIYIAKKLPSIIDEYMNEVEQYDEPKKYRWNVQPVNASDEIAEFGQVVDSIRVATISKRKYMGEFKEFDKVYIDNKPSENEIDYGDNADYRVYAIRPQNVLIRIYFIKLVNNNNKRIGE